MYRFLTRTDKIKAGLILLIMSLLTIMPISGVNSAPPNGKGHDRDTIKINLHNIIELSGGGMAHKNQILAFGTACEELIELPKLNKGDMGPEMKWHLYQLTGHNSVEEMVHEINQQSQQENIDCQVGPNYLIHINGHSVWGSPHDGYGANARLEKIKDQFYEGALEQQMNQGPLPLMTSPQGAGITVAMFDTYCHNRTEDHLLKIKNGFGRIQLEGDYSTHIPATPGPPVNLCGHGEGVASMIKSVAPETDIKLYRVFGDNGFGTLDGLLKALNDFAQSDIPSHTIINLSLGVKADRGDDVPILGELLAELYEKHNVLIVAAAGNEERHTLAQYPAAYRFVIGVVASDHHGNQASYANDGDVLAPGGDGDCGKTNSDATSANLDCLAVLNSQSQTGASYWKGSSFSAGIVSGVAAQLWENDPGLSPQEVRAQFP